MESIAIISLVLLIILVILCVIILTKLKNISGNSTGAVTDEKIDNLSKLTSDSFNAVRSDFRQQNDALRRENADSLRDMSEKIADLRNKNYEQQLSISKTLSEMRDKTDESARAQTRAVTDSIEKMQQSNETKLERMRLTVDEKLTSTLSTRLDDSFKSVSEQLTNVYKSLGEMKELSGGVSALNRVLTNVKTRGNWAEAHLEGILDRIIPGMYVKNYRPDVSREVVEFAVIIPSSDKNQNIYLPIDSKFPNEDYLKLCEAADAADAEGVKAARKALENRVYAEAKDVKKYINPPATTPFAILYLATDSLYAEVISSKSNIADRIHDEFNVMLTGPSTITALLSSLAMGFRTVTLNDKANEIMDVLAAAKAQYDKFGDSIKKAKRKIEEAGSSLDEAASRNNIIVKKLKGVELMDSGKSDEILELRNISGGVIDDA